MPAPWSEAPGPRPSECPSPGAPWSIVTVTDSAPGDDEEALSPACVLGGPGAIGWPGSASCGVAGASGECSGLFSLGPEAGCSVPSPPPPTGGPEGTSTGGCEGTSAGSPAGGSAGVSGAASESTDPEVPSASAPGEAVAGSRQSWQLTTKSNAPRRSA